MPGPFTHTEVPDREPHCLEPDSHEPQQRVPQRHEPVRREPNRRIRRARSLTALGLLGALTALMLAGCGSSGPASTSTGARAGGGAPAADSRSEVSSAPGVSGSKDSATGPGQRPGAPPGAAPSSGSGSASIAPGSGTPLAGVGPKLTKSASLDLQVKDISAAAAAVRSIAAGLQAQVLSEQIGSGDPGGPTPLQESDSTPGNPGTSGSSGSSATPGSSNSSGDVKSSGASSGRSGFGSLTLSVPANKLDSALDQLAGIGGTVLRRSLSSQDVTAQYVDTQSRLKTMRASVDRVRALMTQAKDLGQVVALESELSQREADLESLESQLGELKDSVALSPLTITLSTPSTEPGAKSGFVAGLRSGWDAFTASVGGLLTAIGAVLPFTILLAVAGGSLLWWLRHRRAASAGRANT